MASYPINQLILLPIRDKTFKDVMKGVKFIHICAYFTDKTVKPASSLKFSPFIKGVPKYKLRH